MATYRLNPEKENDNDESDKVALEAQQTNCFGSKRLSLARLRWRFLSRSVLEGPSSQSYIGSTRRFTTFGLVKLEESPKTAEFDPFGAIDKNCPSNSKENVPAKKH